MPPSLHEEIARGYYRTTAGRTQSASREYYDRAADGLLRRLRGWLPDDRNARCIDLACGCGEMLYLLEREGFRHIVGVDLCKEELDHARTHIQAQVIHAEVHEYLKGTETESADFLVALNFLEHLSKDALLSVLTEARRVLRPGCPLVAMVPNATSPFGGLTGHWDITHEWAFTPNNFRQLAALVGFDRDVQFRECRPVVHGIFSAGRYLVWQIIRAGLAGWFLIETGDSKGGVYTMDMLVRLRTLRQ